MPSSVTITPRKIFLEDLQVSTAYSPTLSAQTVGGVGTVSLTPINAVLFSSFPSYASRAAATAALGGGRIYFDSTLGTLGVTTG